MSGLGIITSLPHPNPEISGDYKYFSLNSLVLHLPYSLFACFSRVALLYRKPNCLAWVPAPTMLFHPWTVFMLFLPFGRPFHILHPVNPYSSFKTQLQVQGQISKSNSTNCPQDFHGPQGIYTSWFWQIIPCYISRHLVCHSVFLSPFLLISSSSLLSSLLLGPTVSYTTSPRVVTSDQESSFPVEFHM